MIDLILLAFVLAVFYAGFKCGNKWATLLIMLSAWINTVKGWVDP